MYQKKGYNSWNKGKRTRIERICKLCTTIFYIEPHKINVAKYCSRKCCWKNMKGKSPWNKGKSCPQMAGINNPSWKGGKKINTQGYILIHNPTHPFCDKHRYVRENRLVMEKFLNRYLKPEEQVHHKGLNYPLGSIKNRQDNHMNNLMLFPNATAHTKYHWFLKSKS